MKRIKFENFSGQKETEQSKIAIHILIQKEQNKTANDKQTITEKDVKKRFAEVANDLWGKMGALKVVVNEISSSEESLGFQIVCPGNQRQKVGFLLFFINELNGEKVRIKIKDNSFKDN